MSNPFLYHAQSAWVVVRLMSRTSRDVELLMIEHAGQRAVVVCTEQLIAEQAAAKRGEGFKPYNLGSNAKAAKFLRPLLKNGVQYAAIDPNGSIAVAKLADLIEQLERP